jgi:hypothetical protein
MNGTLLAKSPISRELLVYPLVSLLAFLLAAVSLSVFPLVTVFLSAAESESLLALPLAAESLSAFPSAVDFPLSEQLSVR